MARISRRTRWLILAGVLCAMGVSLFLFRRDEPPPADADLRPSRRSVPREANGFFLLNDPEDVPGADEEEPDPDEAGRDGGLPEDWEEELQPWALEFDRRLAERVLSRHADLVRKFEEGLSRAEFQVPEMENLFLPLPYVLTWRRAVALVLCRSRIHSEDGREEEAWNDALRVIRFGRRIEGGEGTLIHYLTGLNIRERGVRQLLHLIARTRAGPEKLKPVIAKCALLEPVAGSLGEVYKREYAGFSPVIDQATDLDVGSGFKSWWRAFSFKRNQTKRLLAESVRILIAESAKPGPERDADAVAGYTSMSGVDFNSGKGLLALILPLYRKAADRRDLGQLQVAAARVLLGLKCHLAAHGKLPETLAELVPGYLIAVPADPFDGKPLRYSRDQKVIYSVGADRIDSGGSPRDDPMEALADVTEPTFHIDFE